MILKSAISADSLLAKDAFGHPFIYTFYEIMGSLTKYRFQLYCMAGKICD